MAEIPIRSASMDVMIKYAISALRDKAVHSKSFADLEKCEEEFKKLIQATGNHPTVLHQYNEFRISNLTRLPKTRPHILTSGPFEIIYPLSHQYSLFEVADVVCLCMGSGSSLQSTVECTPYSLFYDILKRLPKGFKPDLYWDNQVEHWHYIPHGIETAPFPITASVSHTFLHKSIEHICELFDLILPISKSYSNILKKKYPQKIVELPFGLNWGSFDYFYPPKWEKRIDVCLTFEGIESPIYPYRQKVCELTKAFKQKYQDRFVIEIASGLSRDEYFDLLRNSRITINVTGINGPYNYRTMEAMSAGSMIFQLDWETDSFDNKFSELFLDGVHGVGFTIENFEKKLLYYLEHREETDKIAKGGFAFLKEKYSHTRLYQQFIQIVKEKDIVLPRKVDKHIGYHHVDMIYYNQNDYMDSFISYGLIHSLTHSDWIKYNNDMVYICTMRTTEKTNKILIGLIAEPFQFSDKADEWNLASRFHENAVSIAPKEFLWIVEWNFLLLSFEQGTIAKQDIDNLILLLETTEATPFEEDKVIFKYSVESSRFPTYQMQGRKAIEFLNLNFDLIKVIDKPLKRAQLYHSYALKAAKYFLNTLTME